MPYTLVIVIAQGCVVMLYVLIVVVVQGGPLRARARALCCNGGMAGTRLVVVVDVGVQWW